MDKIRARFNLEAKAVARLQHPNIVQIFEVGEWCVSAVGPPVPYFTLEYVEGGSLSARLAGAPQAPFRAASWLVTLARAVHYAHGQGIVHRDLKPSNVLLTSDGHLKICDFGVAKLLTASAGETLGGLLIGTPEYMAPEQAEGEGRLAQPASDVYALGAILYTMLTGRPVFQGASVLETLEQVRRREPLSPRRLRPAIPAGPGDDLPEMPGERPAAALRECRGPGRRSGAVLERRDAAGTARGGRRTGLEVGTAAPGCGASSHWRWWLSRS